MSAPPPLFGGPPKPPDNQTQNQNQNASGATAAPTSLFGGAAATTTPSAFSAFGSTTTGSNVFGKSPFGNAGQPNAGGSSLFGGAAAAPSGGNLFGAPSTPKPSPFGAPATSSAAAPATAPTTTTNTFFGGAGISTAPKPSLFGAPSTEGTQPPNLFGSIPPANFNPPSASNAGTTSTTVPSVPTSLFGAPPASTTPAPTPLAAPKPAPANSLFGGGATLFGAPKPADATLPSTAPAPPAVPSLFGAPPISFGDAQKSSTPAPDAPKPPASGFAFGGLTSTAPAVAPPTALAAPTTANIFGKPADSTATTASKPSLFGAPAVGIASTMEQKAPAAPSTGFGADFFKKPDASAAGANLFGAPKPAETKAPEPPKVPSLFGAPAATSTEKKADAPAIGASTTTAAAPTPAPAPAPAATSSGAAPTVNSATLAAPPSQLRGKTIEEIVNKWDKELQANIDEFNRMAGEVAAWDKVLIDNGNYITQLYNQVQAAQNSQQTIDQTLTNIEMQQNELSAVLDSYEQQAKTIFEGPQGALRNLDPGPADAERDRNYALATDLSIQLDDLTKSLGQMITTVNELFVSSGAEAGSNAKDDPLTKIAEVLNEHLNSLRWIEGTLGDMEGKMKEVNGRMEVSNGGKRGGNGLKGSQSVR